jgi:putative drug exporter of the RND superfamily
MIHRFAAGFVRWWWLVLAIWAVGLAGIVTAAPDFSDVATFDDAAFLPPGATTARGEALLVEGWPDDNLSNTAVVALVRGDGELGEEDNDYAATLVEWVETEQPGGAGDVTTHLNEPQLADSLTSPDGQAMLVVVGLEVPPYSPPAGETVEATRGWIAENPPPDGLEALVTGAAAVALDEDEVIETSVERTQVLTVVLVLGLLLYIFRSPVAALVPLITVGSAYMLSVSVIGFLANLGMQVSYMYETFAIVIVFGAGTDYSLLAMARYDEELERTLGSRPPIATLVSTMTVLAGVIASSAASTIVGFSAQSVARFGLFRTMGPALAISIALTLVAGLTLTPALMRAFGRYLFWPRRSAEEAAGTHGEADADRVPETVT